MLVHFSVDSRTFQFQAVIILGLAAIASAQVLRISPVVLGSSTAGTLQVSESRMLGKPSQRHDTMYCHHYQVIQLGQGGSVSPYRVQASQVQTARVQPAVHVASAPVSTAYVQQVRPVQFVATQPQVVSYQAAPVSFQAAPGQVTRQTVPVSAARYEVEDESRPSPFAYSFDSEDEFGTKIGRSESSDEQGVVTGKCSTGGSKIFYYKNDNICRIVLSILC